MKLVLTPHRMRLKVHNRRRKPHRRRRKPHRRRLNQVLIFWLLWVLPTMKQQLHLPVKLIMQYLKIMFWPNILIIRRIK
nr:MAG TPA: hypothetical protein [Caudoviricetes sp.]